MFVFHNNVNTRINKPLITYEEHNMLYQNMNLEMVIRNMLQIYQNMLKTIYGTLVMDRQILYMQLQHQALIYLIIMFLMAHLTPLLPFQLP